ncbi:MAG: hypothetical protein ACTSRK_10830 [Promethearchaeota archaeon]
MDISDIYGVLAKLILGLWPQRVRNNDKFGSLPKMLREKVQGKDKFETLFKKGPENGPRIS